MPSYVRDLAFFFSHRLEWALELTQAFWAVITRYWWPCILPPLFTPGDKGRNTNFCYKKCFPGLSALPLPAGAQNDFLVPSFYAYDQSARGSESWRHLHFWLSPVLSSSGLLEEPVAQWVLHRWMWPGSGRGSRGWRVPAALGYWGSVALSPVETNPLPPLCFFALCFLTCIQSITPLCSHFFPSNESNAEKSLKGISHSKGSSNLSLFSPLTFFSPNHKRKTCIKGERKKEKL